LCFHLEQAASRLPPELSPLVGFSQDTLIPTALERWDAASKALLESQGHLDVLQSHQAKGTFPQAILKACSSFELKFCKDVCKPEVLSEAKRKVEDAISFTRKTMLESAMALRKNEIANSAEFLEPSTFKRGVLEYIQKEIEPLVAAVPGIELLLWERTLKPFYEAVYQDIDVEVKRRSLVNALAADQKAKAKAARDLAAADARAGMDVDALDSTVTETAKNAAGTEVSKRMKALQTQAHRSLALSAHVRALTCTLPDRGAPGQSQEPDRGRQETRPPSSPSSSSHNPNSKRKHGQGFSEDTRQRQQGEGLGWKSREATSKRTRQTGRRRQEEEDSVVLQTLGPPLIHTSGSSPLRAVDIPFSGVIPLNKPDKWPLDFWRLSPQERPKFLLAHSKLLFAETLMAPPKLINPEGFQVPREIEKCLAMNVKFIPKPVLNTQEPRVNWDKFVRSVRLKYLFAEKDTDHSPTGEFDPRFYIANPRYAPPRAAPSIEYGLRIGRASLEQAMVHAEQFTHIVRPNLSKKTLHALQDFLSAEDALIKPADKNLGLVVLSRAGYVREGTRQLSDTSTYSKVDLEANPVTQIISELIAARRTLVEETFKNSPLTRFWLSQKKGLLKFLCHPTAENTVLPEFHHLPKVHKVPLKGRPIVPSHSWVTTHVSRYVDSLLQPIVQSCEWILRDSQQLIQQLAHLELPENETLWLVTADIQSMYTNLPSSEGCNIMHWLGLNHYKDDGAGRLLKSFSEFVLGNNYLSFQNEVYHQTQGTAMGTPMAPTYANLFMAAFEQESEIPYSDTLLYYRRYIDDVLAIVRGPRSNADKFIQNLNTLHPALKFDAEVSSSCVSFLDVHLYLKDDPNRPGCTTLQTKVYQKPLNAYQYIPWSSYHPDTVKRSFVKGELTRYARISSSPEEYKVIASLFWRRLRQRGYPVRWLRNAFKVVDYFAVRNRVLGVKAIGRRSQQPLVYHISYNPVWQWVNGAKVLSHTIKHWKPKYHRLTGTAKGNIIRAVHRPRNLGDLVNTWNKQRLSSGAQSLS